MEHRVVEQGARDVTEIIRRAHKREQRWTHDSVAAVLQNIKANCAEALIDWEAGAEEWGRVLVGNQVVALVSVRFPLVIVQIPHEEYLQNQNCFEVLKVESMSRNAYSADRGILETVFEKDLSDSVDYGNMSIDELWWATV